MVLALRGMIGRGMARTAGQVAMSVLATLIATSLYSELRRGYRDVTAVPPPPPLTSGGKFGTRVEGAEMPPLPEPARPVLSVVNWAIVPPGAVAIPDPGSVAFARPAVDVQQPADTRPIRRVARKAVPPVVTPPVRPVLAATATPSAAPAMAAAAPVPPAARSGLLASASAIVGQTAHSVVDLGGTALALGGHAVSHLVPWQR